MWCCCCHAILQRSSGSSSIIWRHLHQRTRTHTAHEGYVCFELLFFLTRNHVYCQQQEHDHQSFCSLPLTTIFHLHDIKKELRK